jgi:hypothetical protein
MLPGIDPEKVLFVDIETVSQHPEYKLVPEAAKPLWQQKGAWFARQNNVEWNDETASSIYQDKAAIYAEFGKVLVISVGYLRLVDDVYHLKLKSYAGRDERVVLEDFSRMLNGYYKPGVNFLCGHNIKEFDVPYLCRRMIINDLQIPEMINVVGKKPWETQQLLDTMTLWKFGDFKNFTSLNLLAHVLSIPTPKDDIDGSMVGRVFWEENDIDRIRVYCEKDVATCARVLLKLLRKGSIQDANIESASA